MAAAPRPIMVIVAGSGTGEVVASAPEILGWRRSLNPPGSVNSGAHDRFAVGRHNRQEILAMAESILKYPWKFRQTIGIKRIHRYGGVSGYATIAGSEKWINDDVGVNGAIKRNTQVGQRRSLRIGGHARLAGRGSQQRLTGGKQDYESGAVGRSGDGGS